MSIHSVYSEKGERGENGERGCFCTQNPAQNIMAVTCSYGNKMWWYFGEKKQTTKTNMRHSCNPFYFHAFPQESLHFKVLSRIHLLKELRTFMPRRGRQGVSNHAITHLFSISRNRAFFSFSRNHKTTKMPITQSRIPMGGGLHEPLHRSGTLLENFFSISRILMFH